MKDTAYIHVLLYHHASLLPLAPSRPAKQKLIVKNCFEYSQENNDKRRLDILSSQTNESFIHMIDIC